MNIHLLNDLGVYKASLKAKFYRDFGERVKDGDEHAIRARDLLERRGQLYTLEECYVLAGYLVSSHDVCVLDNPDDYSKVEYWTSQVNEAKCNQILDFLDKLKANKVILNTNLK